MPDPFAALIAGLERAGLSRPEIARQANVSPTTIWRMANGVNNDHMAGPASRIARLHERVVGCDATKKGVES
ncbi:helix-turn-helix domain-containing protein [Mesorhizobium sp. NZP2298]|uniref:helix-turn-helix domain-containing protein n=1 Tax=Mesorhizobium sp. NZP2298 TaxID=2483403 RepID=UPI00155252BC|nr:helix-turn-helix transcriptional regulator [Mesorhizobium sp. NZP2298]QKC96783.1 XRE family transcriptional regulator [Mesorhizobium sp. NZP2298]